jgi:hypothetical protein
MIKLSKFNTADYKFIFDIRTSQAPQHNPKFRAAADNFVQSDLGTESKHKGLYLHAHASALGIDIQDIHFLL